MSAQRYIENSIALAFSSYHPKSDEVCLFEDLLLASHERMRQRVEEMV